MKVVVERTGGFGGLKRRGERSGQDLSGEQRAALDQVLRDWETERSAGFVYGKQQGSESVAGADNLEPETPANPGADQFTYRIVIEDEDGARSITMPDSKMPKELKGIVL